MNMSEFNVEEYIEKYRSGSISYEDLRAYSTYDCVSVPILDGFGKLAYTKSIYLDNAATLPLFMPVSLYARLLEEKYRSNVGRSYGYKERLVRLATGQARIEALKYFGAPSGHIAVLGTNVTSLFLTLIKHINKSFPNGNFLVSPMSHSAISIPIHGFEKERWRHIALDSNLDYDLIELAATLTKLEQNDQDVTIAIETISNVTGFETNWTEVLKMAEFYGARVILDNAQGACFVEIELASYNCDIFVGVSGHKMGARDGSAVLVGPQKIFELSHPLEPTAGMIFNYTEDREFFMPAPATLEPGTPNYIAQASLAESFRLLNCVGLKNLRAGIGEMTAYLAQQLSTISSIQVLGSTHHKPRFGPLSFVAFTDEGREIPSMAIAACLSYFHGIQVRANHHCAPILVQRLKGISNEDANEISRLALASLGQKFDTDSHPLTRHLQSPADPLSALHSVRPSVSFSTTPDMIEALVIALKSIIENKEYQNLKIIYNRAFGFNEYVPKLGDSSDLRTVLFPDVTIEALMQTQQ
jgi:selenocysteine lyase/cysteine desulfurase